jgi:hypothetical protein
LTVYQTTHSIGFADVIKMKFFQRHWLFLVVIAGYSFLAIPQLNHGLATLDSHGVVATIRNLADFHHVTLSHPPGHPTTEIYLYGAISLVLRGVFDKPFTDTIYMWLQFSVGIATACVFYEWLCRLKLSFCRAAGAVCCLVFSGQFLLNTIDGEEFVVAILFLLAAFRVLSIGEHERVSLIRIYISMLCFALAVGCRAELLPTGVIYPIFFYSRPELGFKRYIKALPVQIGLVTLVWLPTVLSIGIVPPYPSHLTWKLAVLGGVYKLIFQCFTLPVFVLFCWTLVSEAKKMKSDLIEPFPMNFILPASWVIGAMYPFLFFGFALKPAYVFVIVPFCLLLAARQSQVLLISLAVCTLVGLFINVDIFRDRRLTGLHLKPGVYFETTRQKPFYRLPYLRGLSKQCGENPIAVIGDVYMWDVDYNVARGSFQAEKRIIEDKNAKVAVFSIPQSHCLLLTVDAPYHPALLQKLRLQGFSIMMDRMLYRRQFERYNVHSTVNDTATIMGVPVTLFSD